MSSIARPLYVRLLRLQHLRPSAVVTFALFEGSIGAAVLLALAEIVSWWGVLAIPVTVALMVKLNDVVAGSLVGPLAFAAPRFAGTAPTSSIASDQGAAETRRAGRPDGARTIRGQSPGVARGVAAVPADVPAQHRRRPKPNVAEPESPHGQGVAESCEYAGTPPRPDPAVRRNRGNQGRFGA